MKLGQRGLNLILEFEGKLVKLPDGRYKAYLCPAGVPTIFAGCTVGVRLGMIVTEDEGETMFRSELARFERCVLLACTREPNQNQFDSFVSLSYNIGEAGFRRSSVLSHFNAGRIEKAAQAFALWNKGGGKVLRGLVRRRAAEAGLFMRPVEAPVAPEMPQKVDPSMTTGDKAVVVAQGTAGGLFGNFALGDPLQIGPAAVNLTNTAVQLKSNGGQLFSGVDLMTWGVPFAIVLAAGGLLWWVRRPA